MGRESNSNSQIWSFEPRDIRVSLVHVVTVFIAMIWGMSYIDSRFDASEVRVLRTQWTIMDQLRWAELLERDNPELTVPDTDDVWRYHRRSESPATPDRYLTPWTRRDVGVLNPRASPAVP